uniref:PI3K/PI4K domain-containing protein n=1 Tax=Caenorhabditis tropicalis TaxID=1561998 RepID=A0A1I7TA88_9PELO
MASSDDIGGRKLPYQLGEPKYDDDVYRGQRRRPWMCFRVGVSSMEFTQEHFINFITIIRNLIIEAGILIDDDLHVLKITCTEDDYGLLRTELDEGLRKSFKVYPTGVLSIPIVILLLDKYDAAQVDEVSYEYSGRVYFFKMDRTEALELLKSSNLEEIRKECKTFAQLLAATEGLSESIAYQFPLDERHKVFGVVPDDEDDILEETEEQKLLRIQEENQLLTDEEIQHRLKNLRLINEYEEMGPMMGPPGIRPPGLSNQGTSRPKLPTSFGGPSHMPPGLPPPGLSGPPGLSVPRAPPGLSMQKPPGLEALSRPPGILARTPSPLEREESPLSGDFSSPTTSFYEEEKEVVGAHILDYRTIRDAIGTICVQSTSRGVPVIKHMDSMAKSMNGSKIYERFEHPFIDITHNVDLLLLLNYALASKNPDIISSSKQLLRGLFQRGYSVKVRRKFLDHLFASGRWSDEAATLLFELVILYFNTARYKNGFMLSIDTFVPTWRDLCGRYNECDKRMLTQAGVSEREFLNMGRLITHIEKWIKHAEEVNRNGSVGRRMDRTFLDESMIMDSPDHRACSSRDIESRASSDYRGSSASNRREDEYRRAREDEEYRRSAEAKIAREEAEIFRRAQEARRAQEKAEFRRAQESRRDREEEEYIRAREEEEHRRIQESRRAREEEEYRKEQHENRRREEEEKRRRRQEEEDRLEEEYQRRDDERKRQADYDRRRREEMGFRKGGGAVDSDGEYPILDISDQEDDVLPVVEKDTDEKPKQPYKYEEACNDDDYEPMYVKSERMEPPEDFKTLTAVPTMSDYVNPKQPYLRRIQELGVYKSAHHYLDVQFRLLREDLISPMRDGINIYRLNGTCKGNRKPDEPCSDISLFSIEIVDGKQVTEREGTEMRLIWPAQYDIMNLLENDREMKELGLVMLSCDRFVEDFHLGHIQMSMLVNRGCLQLAVHEETRPFQPNKTYQMAQATSYLPSYKHVLQNLKTISPFKPIPFERYLVHGRKHIFRPNFHRHTKTEEQEEEEQRLQKIYTDIRSAAASQRYMDGKAVPKGLDDDNDSYEFSKMNEPKKHQIDLEYLQLREPIYREFIGVDTRGSDQIQINKKWYKISRLLDDFHPTNMDESQRQAFCNTFKHELSLIQGPPGTGKTHIGVEIIKTMLHNRMHWKMTEPILVVCFTNSGLDNLLERVYDMIENDEELSRDNGRPKMIRYGRKCESDYLKRRNVMRYDAHDLYKSLVSEAAQRDQSKAGSLKRKAGADLVLSSYTLYCSRNDILSYLILSRVMDPSHQAEINTFAYEHVDSKGYPLGADEAIACWLLDRDFGKASKLQTKSKKNKFQEMSADSDEEVKECLTVEDSDDEDGDEEMDDEKRLDKLFDKMNLGCTGKDILGLANGSAGDEYYTKGTWEIAHDHRPPEVVLMGKKIKSKGNSNPVDEHINGLVKEIKEMILSTQPLPKHELEDCKYIFSLSRPKRWALYKTWCDAVRSLVVEGLPKQIDSYRLACQRFQAAQDHFDAEIMRLPMIVGATTTGCSRLRPILECVEPRILIVEEAAEVLEAHILSAMISTIEHCVMIGDHKQLRPNPAVHELGVEYGMRISMFERLVERALPYSQLREQHRMNILISDTIVKSAFYDNVVDAENVGLYPDVEGMATNLYFWSHHEQEETPDGVSWLNRREAEMVVVLVRHLLKQNYTTQDIVVLATYAAQRQYMYREYPSIFGSSPDQQLIPVETVDSFQGRERKIAIVSLVRSHRGKQENTGIGFLAVANRICVALTRAQHGMYIIGNGAYIKNNSQLWHKIVERLNRKRLIQYFIRLKCVAHGNEIECLEPSDFKRLSPEGGCLEKCNIVKRCGHICERPCHPKIEIEHMNRCEYPCKMTCSNPKYNHKCAKMCFEDCGSCMCLVEVYLKCGHTVSTPCSRIHLAQCDQLCKQKLQCGHNCPMRCGAECIGAADCKQMVPLELMCGHSKQMRCNELTHGDPNLNCIQQCENMMLTCQHQCKELCGKPCTTECKEMVSVKLPCKHSQDVICSSYEPDCLDLIKCTNPVTKSLSPCGHLEPIPCSKEPTTDLCTRTCTKIIKECNHVCGDRCGNCFLTQNHSCQQRCQIVLDCGHNCSAKCGERCPPCKAYCLNWCTHQGCGAIGERTYARGCSELCVLCTANCSNKCIHRSCTKKCFEECNVKTCIEPCTEKLKCGHACLGMCGEICPKICGTCERARYLECVSTASTQQRVHRLIQIPKCSHIFPAEQLDEHVKKLKEQGAALKCEKCQASMVGILRYAKYCKKFYLDENIKRSKAKVSNIHHSTIEYNLREKIQNCVNELRLVNTNMSDEAHGILLVFHHFIEWISAGAEEYKGKAEQKWRMAFLLDIARCFRAIARMVSMTSKQRISSRKDVPPALDNIILQSFGNQPFFKILEELRKVNEYFGDNGKTFMLGAVLPRLRMHIFKMATYQMVSALIHSLCINKQGVSEQITRTLNSNCYVILNGDDRQNMETKLKIIEDAIISIVPNLSRGQKYLSWADLDVPQL